MKGAWLLLLTLLLLAFLLGAALSGTRPSPGYRAALETQRLETQARVDAIRLLLWAGLATAIVLGALGAAAGLTRLLWRRGGLVHPNDQGLYPIVQRGDRGSTVFHDPNRQIAGTTLYHAGPDGVAVTHALPEGLETAQVQIATQAQAAQLVAAASRSAPGARQAQRLARQLSAPPPPHMPAIQVLSPEVPEERHLLAAIRRDWEKEENDGDLTGHPTPL